MASRHPERGSARLRMLDRMVGIPLIVALSPLRLARGRRMLPNVQRIGVLKSAAIGDTALMLGALQDLREAFPKAEITFYAGGSNYELAALAGGVDDVIMLPATRPLAAVRRIRQKAFDLFIDFGAWPRLDALLSFASRSGFTVGFRTAGQGRHLLYDMTVPHGGDRHEHENYRALLRAIGVVSNSLPRLEVTDGGAGEPYVIFHMWPGGSGRRLKMWPAERWEALAVELAGRGHRVALTGAPGDWDENRRFAERCAAAHGIDLVNLAGCSLRETIGYLSRSPLVVSVDTGIMHVAAAVGAPLVSLHGPTSSQRWGPVGARCVAIDSPVPGCGYLSLGFDFKGKEALECMEGIKVDAVLEACESLGIEHAVVV